MNKNKIIIAMSVIALLFVSVFNVCAGVSVYYEDWKLEIPSSVNSTEYYVAGYNGSETSVVLPSVVFDRSVSRINDFAFMNNTNLEYCTISQTVKIVGEGAFYGCTSLKEVFVPESVEAFGVNSFYNCSSLVKVDMGSNVRIKDIPMSCFNKCSELENFTVTQGVKTIGDFAFMNCSELNTVIIPPSVDFISSNAFYGCDNLAVYGWDDTYAQQYAKEQGITFVSYGEYTDPTTPPETSEATEPDGITEPSSAIDASDTSEPVINTGIMGDVNGDDEVNIKDATEIQKYAASLSVLTEDALISGDVTQDSEVNIKDATAIQKHIAGIETGYPIGKTVE